LTLAGIALLFGAGLIGGAMNALAGGGSFVTFPAMVYAGLPALIANASSTVALFPGALTSTWATRADLGGVGDVKLPVLLAISVAGGLSGAILLLATPVSAFDGIVPWLLLVATLAFSLGHRAGAALRRRVRVGPAAILVTQFVLGVYGGYFGGAVGIMMMAAWSLLATADLRRLTPARTFLVGMTNLAAIVCFVIAGKVSWPDTLVVLVGGALGGFGGAHLGRRLPIRILRGGIIAITVGMTALFFWRAYR
jgi:uncharacterized membrane protein YfcA